MMPLEMRSIATLRSLLWSPRLPITQPARAGLGGTNGSAQDQGTPRGTRRRFESPQRRSEFGDFTGRLARKTNGASSHVVARTANGASSDVVLGELSPYSINLRDDEALVAGRGLRRGCGISNLVLRSNQMIQLTRLRAAT